MRYMLVNSNATGAGMGLPHWLHVSVSWSKVLQRISPCSDSLSLALFRKSTSSEVSE